MGLGQSASGGANVAVQRAVRSRPLAFLEREGILGYILVAPALLVLLIFVAYPFVYGVWLSLTDTFVGQESHFIGIQNFIAQLNDDIYRRAVINSFVYTIVSCTAKFFSGLGLAVVLNQKFPLRRFVRGRVLLPWIIPIALGALVWIWMFDSTFSVFNWLLKQVGIKGPLWLGEGYWPMVSLIILNIWRGTAFYGICFLAGMQTISEELYEAAVVDGANPWQKFWRITFPLLIPVTVVVTLLSIILTFADFQSIYVLTGGGPAHQTQVFGTWAYFLGIFGGQLGAGAAVSLTMFPVLAIVILLTLVALRRE